MKRMNEVFDFNNPIGYPASWSDEQVRRGNKAIKNADALADALEKAINLLSRPASTRLIHEQELLNTLNAYRGAK